MSSGLILMLFAGWAGGADYIEIAKLYHVQWLSLEFLDYLGCDDLARRFLHLVDEFYDRSVNLL